VHLSRRELIRIVGLVLVAWVVVLVGLATLQRSRSAGARPGEPSLPRYPGTEGLPEQRSEPLGMRKYWFEIEEQYPSRSVYHWYRRVLREQGWQMLGQDADWMRRGGSDGGHDVLHATWVSPDRLFQVDVEMLSRVRRVERGPGAVSEEREPGIQVYVTLRRVLAPHLLAAPRERSAPGPERPGIELP